MADFTVFKPKPRAYRIGQVAIPTAKGNRKEPPSLMTPSDS